MAPLPLEVLPEGTLRRRSEGLLSWGTLGSGPAIAVVAAYATLHTLLPLLPRNSREGVAED